MLEFPYRSPALSLPYKASDDRAATLKVVVHITVCKAAQSYEPSQSQPREGEQQTGTPVR